MRTVGRIEDFFAEQLSTLACDDHTRAYIVSVLSRFRSTVDDLSNESLTLRYSHARERHSFTEFQRIGDYLFFCQSVYPQSLQGASVDYYHSVARGAYHSCYRLMNRSFQLYERLADEFVPLTTSTRAIIRRL